MHFLFDIPTRYLPKPLGTGKAGVDYSTAFKFSICNHNVGVITLIFTSLRSLTVFTFTRVESRSGAAQKLPRQRKSYQYFSLAPYTQRACVSVSSL
jgi:hypothetical protein